MAPESLAMPADIWVLHMNIVKKMKISKSFETPFFHLKRCLVLSMTFLHSDNAIFRESMMWVASLSKRVLDSRALTHIMQKSNAETNFKSCDSISRMTTM